VDTHTLLYPGATTKIYTNIMYWFGPSNHIQVGYNSTDPAQVQKQVDDHVSRGIDGTIVDWYGIGHTFDDTGTQLMMRYAETLPGTPFTFAIMEDKGALLSCSRTIGCDLNKQLIADLTYVYNTYQGSPAYMKFNGQPVVFFFGLDGYNLNWDYVKASVPGNPLFIFQSNGGFTHAATSGAFSWVMINTSDPNDWKQSYLDSFYQTALKNPAGHAVGAAWKGFNDTLASWSLNRIVNQNCGQTWLKTWNEVGKYYNSTNQLESLQITTWNDYEEGTEIESGIENCVAISASSSDTSVAWTISGDESTIDHYTVFISLDGENLMPLADASRGIRTLDLSQFGLAPGSYTLYVKAVGVPSMTNKMSGAVTYWVPDPGPDVSFVVTPLAGIAPVTVSASTAGSTSPAGAIVSGTIDFGDGTVVSATSASHAYATPGNYTVTATVIDNMNVAATKMAQVTVVADKPPMAYLSVSPASGTAPVTMTASTAAATDPDDQIVASSIDFGDGTVVNAAMASHTYITPGTYTITGTVTDGYGASSSAAASVTVAAPVIPGKVVVNAPLDGATVTSPVHFVASATANTGNYITTTRIYVDYVSAYTVSGATLDTNLRMLPGTHKVMVQSWDNKGLVYKTPLTITVQNQPPVIALSVSPTSTVTGTPVSVSMAGTSDPDGSVASYAIDFGDGALVNAISGSHAYAKGGTYTVKATAIDNLGAVSTATRAVTISAPAPVYGVKVSSPANGATTSSPVHFVASASSKYPITAMRIYVDGVSAYTVNAASLDTWIKMSLGTRNVVVQAWDSTGAVFKTPLTLTIR
jgi:PKD repeat protein